MLHYNVRANYIAGAKSPCRLEVVNLVSHTQEEWLEQASRRSGLPLSMLEGAWSALISTAGDYAEAGEGLATDLFSARPSITGGADSMDANYTKGVNEVRYNFTAGPAIMKRLVRTTPYKAESYLKGPVITCVRDVYQKLDNSYLTPGGTFRLFGNGLAIAGAAGETGVELIDSSGRRTLLGADELAINRPSMLVGRVPELPDGPIELSVITAYTAAPRLLKTPHKTTFDGSLRIGRAPPDAQASDGDANKDGEPRLSSMGDADP